ncbi:multiple myeloma tumor-associated protein 2 [Striga asiatica]|uniref:Multiple myeloma tumor-associated protein 2 n=1 Tax=Striga asiatica TaxID=4170 RepID=A0A5A7R1F9_STRAF|nr:multiple myeloma tumor-associated protein 2 [Striga asiatica]
MYHPTRGGVRGGRDQFSWDDVKVDKHRENYLGHSIKAPVGRWQKGKDLHWYTRDKKSDLDSEAMKEEIRRIKEEEEQAMREALGLAPKRASKSQGNRLDKHEFAELVKRGSTAEDVGAGHAEAAQVHGLGFARGGPRPLEDSNLPSGLKTNSVEKPNADMPTKSTKNVKEETEDESSRKRKRRHDEKKRDKREKEKQRYDDSDDNKRRHKKDRERRRHD